MIIGANHDTFPALAGAVPGVTGRRIYCARRDTWPATWPALAGTVTADVLSIRPTPVSLLAGEHDTSLKHLISSAPYGSRLTCWHEAGSLAEYSAMPDITPANITAVHQHMWKLCMGTGVGYGAILCMPPQQMSPWLPPGLHWYGLDIYDWPEFHWRNTASIRTRALYNRLDYWAATVEAINGDTNCDLLICETNSHYPQHRPQWFTSVAEWALDVGAAGMLTFWHAAGAASGAWDSADTATIAALRAAAEAS